MAFEIVGREEELGSLGAFLHEEAGGPRALVLEGEAGIGKSTLWRAGVEEAHERGFRVLSSRPTEAERALAHVVLSDLFEGVLDEVLPALSAPRRQALEVALLAGGGSRAADRPAHARRGGADGPGGARRAGADRARRRRHPVARPVLDERARVRAATYGCRPRASAPGQADCRRRADRRRSSEHSSRRESTGCRSCPSASARSIGSCATGSGARSRARRCCASTRPRGGTRSLRWSWPALSAQMSTPCNRSLFPRRSRSSSAQGSPVSRPRPARRSSSPQRWVRRRPRSWSGRGSRPTLWRRQSTRT